MMPEQSRPSGASAAQTRQESAAPQRKKRRDRAPMLARIMLIPFLLFIALIAGAITGYSILGKGSAVEVFDLHTWKHMYDLVFS
ncbi:DNA-directed RNA polymerase subunit beta [Aneurinibacillus soli]|uniref:DNA-directed RNA polymerase subunit beta n=1 Tax=Aneurinibacillus soli TaxID=1500254 RepID=A0A0U5BEC5_9BACL|nr:DNA-directed RNA polymerase subunit beta [Aneurinibacillus soli]PYE61551.1 DNA-directed RNA polymerase subunit beta [Aneurinibacillus soli]BAU26494.1 DNA-directed RNA polymerase subunit beta [Aneurinibacillus soli]